MTGAAFGPPPRVELHSALCLCGGGAFVKDGREPRCGATGDALPEDAVVISGDDWERLGRPATAEAYAVAHRQAGDRRASPRFRIPIRVRLRREDGAEGGNEESTFTEDIGEGGAMVALTSLTLGRGDRVRVSECAGLFSTTARVQSVFVGDDDRLRACLQFLDADLARQLRAFLHRRTEAHDDSKDPAARR